MKVPLFIVCAVLCGCAGSGANYSPMVDFRVKDSSEYEADLADCRDYASSTAGPGDGAVAGAAIGGLIMALLAPQGYRNDWALSGMAVGAAGGAVKATETQQEIIKRCLHNRGYSVLN